MQGGATALYLASESGHHEVTTLLLDRRASVDAATKVRHRRHSDQESQGVQDGRTSLHIASQCGHVDVIRLLLARGANVHIVAMVMLKRP